MKAALMSILIGALLAPTLRSSATHTSRSRSFQVSITLRGVTLTLRLPNNAYPLGALVRSTVTVKNGTGTQLSIGLSACRADGPNPTVRVLNAQSRVVFPTALPDPPLQTAICTAPPLPSMPPGTSRSWHFYMAIRGARVRAVATAYGIGVLKTPFIHIHAGPANPPTLSLVTSPAVHAVVKPSRFEPSRILYYTDWYVCGRGTNAQVGGETFSEAFSTLDGQTISYYTGRINDWVTTGTYLAPGCQHPRQWHVAAAWLGQSVAYLNYGSR